MSTRNKKEVKKIRRLLKEQKREYKLVEKFKNKILEKGEEKE